jgi:hypothetical protein
MAEKSLGDELPVTLCFIEQWRDLGKAPDEYGPGIKEKATSAFRSDALSRLLTNEHLGSLLGR